MSRLRLLALATLCSGALLACSESSSAGSDDEDVATSPDAGITAVEDGVLVEDTTPDPGALVINEVVARPEDGGVDWCACACACACSRFSAGWLARSLSTYIWLPTGKVEAPVASMLSKSYVMKS